MLGASEWFRIRRGRVVTVAVIVGLAALAGLVYERPPVSSRTAFAWISRQDPPKHAGDGPAAGLRLPPSPFASTGDGKVKRCRNEKREGTGGGSESSVFESAAAEQVLTDLARQISSRAMPTGRALGQYMQMVFAGSKAEMAYESKYPGCAEDAKCQDDARRAATKAASIHREAIVKSASTSDIPQVYALGFYACGSIYTATSDSQCSQLSAEQWARLEPANAIPWLYVADAAAKRGDVSARDEALYRASQARSIDSHWSVFSAVLQSDELKAQPLEVQAAIDAGVIGITYAVSVPPFSPVDRNCSADAVIDPNRRQVCNDLIEVMTERSDTLIDLLLGAKLAERVGLPPDRVRVLHDRADAQMQISLERGAQDLESCETLRKLHAWVGDTFQYGEIGANQRAIVASGQTELQLAMRLRAEQRRSVDQPTDKGSAEAR